MFSVVSRILFICLTVLLVITGCSREEPQQRAEDHASRSEAYLRQGQYRAAAIEATNAINAAPNDTRYRLALAEIYNRIGASRRASSLLEDVVETNPQDVALVLAEAYLAHGRFLSAREALEKFNPEDEGQSRQKKLLLADSARVQGNAAQSQAEYLSLLEQYPNDLEIMQRLAENAILQRDLDAAQQWVDQLLEAQPKNPKSLKLYGHIAYERNDLADAERSLTQALFELPTTDIMLPARAEILHLLSETLTGLGRMTESMVYRRLLAEGNEGTAAAQQRFNEALAALEAGQQDKAAAILRELLKENPENRAAATMLGVITLSMGDTEAAESLLSASLDVETASSGMIRVAALAQAGVGDTKQALATLDRALQARPNDVTLLAMQGLLALSIPEREQEGYRSLQKALSIEPQHSRLRLALARYHYWKGEDEQGMAQLRTAFKYQPADWMVTDTYINLLLVQQQLAEIESVVAELKTAAPKAREVVLYEAQLIYRRGDRNAAIQKLQNLLSSNSAFEQGHAVLAQMQWEAGQLENALGSIERVLQINPANRQALRAGAGLLAGRSGGLSPQEWLQQMADKYAESIELTRNSAGLRAMLYRDEGKLDQAVAALSGYEGTENEYLRQVKSTIYRDQANRSVGRADFSRAREQLLNALALFPQSKTLNLDLARVEIGAKRFGEAKALLDDIESRFPEDPEVITVRAGVVRAEQGAGPAYQLLSQAWEQRPHTFMAPLLVSLATSEAPSAVAGILARWEAIAPDDRARLLYVASWHQQQNNNADAIQAYEQILDDNPQDAIVLNNLAWLLKDSDLSRAAAYAKSAAELQPKVASILDTYGWLLHLQGKNEQALQYLERAVELAPEVSDIRQHRDQVRAAL